MSETIVLDPTAVATNRTQLDITSFVKADGVNWGDAQFEAIMAEGDRGSLAVDGRLPNRMVEIPLSLRTVPGTTFKSIRASLQEKVGLMQREGGWVMRQVNAVPLYADVVNATLHLGGALFQAYRDFDVEATLTLECLPDWYGAEVDLGDNVETTNPELIFTDTGVAGNYPGRCRLVVDNDSATAQNGLLWGFRSRYYDGGITAGLAYECEVLGALNGAASAALSGASGGNVLRSNTLPANVWAPIMVTNVNGTTPMTHKGTYRVWVRAYSTDTTPQLRLKWGVGGISVPTTNETAAIPASGGFYILDLGEVRLNAAPVGTHQWFGVVEAQVPTANGYVGLDRIWFQPMDESAGRLTSVTMASPTSLSDSRPPALSQNDATSGSVDWVNPNYANVKDSSSATILLGAGSTSKWLKSNTFGTNFVPTGSTIRGIEVRTWWNAASSGGYFLTHTSKLVKAGAILTGNSPSTNTSTTDGAFQVHVLGGPTDLWGTTWTPTDINHNTNFGVATQFSVISADADVGIGIGFHQITIWYTLATGFTAVADAIAYGTSPVELRTEGIFRRDTAGTAYGPVSSVLGDLPRIPPSGLEGRTVQTFVKMTRGNFESTADSAIDDISARLYYRPSYLYVPGTA